MKKKGINIIIAFVVALIMSVNVAEAADCLGEDVRTTFSESILGREEDEEKDSGILNKNTSRNLYSNIITVDWVSTENSIILYVTNVGIDSVDLVAGKIETGNLTKNFSYKKVKPGKHIYSVTVPLKSCHENIKIRYWGTDDGVSFSKTTSRGSRDIPKSLLNKWSVGGRGTRANSLDYHFKKHGKGVKALNICVYVRMADAFRTYTIPNEGLKPYKKVSGATANCYRYRNKYFYLDVVCKNKNPSGELVSFGER